MKKLFTIGAATARRSLIPLAVCVTAALSLYAASPAFKSASGNGTASIPAQVLLPADPYSQIRVISAFISTDTNNSSLRFQSGTSAYDITLTNTLSSDVTNRISSTNGLAPGKVLFLQHGGTNFIAVISSFNQDTNGTASGAGTNVVLASGGWGIVTAVGDDVYLGGATNSIPEPAAASGTTSPLSINGEALYVADYSGRPVRAWVSPAFSTNQINNLVYRLE